MVLSALATGGIAFAYSGLRQILDFGGEARNPQRNIPIDLVVVVVIGAASFLWAVRAGGPTEELAVPCLCHDRGGLDPANRVLSQCSNRPQEVSWISNICNARPSS